MIETGRLSPMTSHSTTPMARVAAALTHVWADTQTVSRRIAEQQRWQIPAARRTP
jgi:hypothetical protein